MIVAAGGSSKPYAADSISRSRVIGKLANADAGRVPDRIGDRAGASRDPDLADALDAKGVDVQIMLLDENGLDRGNVGIHRHMIFSRDLGSSRGRIAGP